MLTLTIARFELNKRLGMIPSYVYFALFFFFGLMSMLGAGGAFSNVSVGAGTEKVLANSPIIVQAMISTLSIVGVLVTASVFGQAVHQDFENNCDAIFFTKPVSKASYLGGRFLGALIFSAMVLASIAAGVLAASLSPFWVERSFSGPTRLVAFAWPYVTIVGAEPDPHRRPVLLARRALAPDDARLRRRGDPGDGLARGGRAHAGHREPHPRRADRSVRQLRDGRDCALLDRRREEHAAHPLHRPPGL